MAMMSFHIELRVGNVSDDKMMQALRKAVQQAGGLLHAKATLLCADTGTGIELIMRGQDFENGDREIPAQEGG